MSHFLYISEVYCPWCYGFSPVIERIAKENPLPFEVMCGALIEEPVSLKSRLIRTPNIGAFIDRMHKVTGVRISEAYEEFLQSEQNDSVVLDSAKGGLLFFALKSFFPEKALQIMKDLQHMLYGKGLDVLAIENIQYLATAYQIDVQELMDFMASEENQEKAHQETEESFDIMADVVLYPTLYYVNDDNERIFISRGFVEYEECNRRLQKAIQGDTTEDEASQSQHNTNTDTDEQSGQYCTLDGHCE